MAFCTINVIFLCYVCVHTYTYIRTVPLNLYFLLIFLVTSYLYYTPYQKKMTALITEKCNKILLKLSASFLITIISSIINIILFFQFYRHINNLVVKSYVKSYKKSVIQNFLSIIFFRMKIKRFQIDYIDHLIKTSVKILFCPFLFSCRADLIDHFYPYLPYRNTP